MSLRGQFFVSLILSLILGLSGLGAVACWQARRSVDHEMTTALEASDRIVDNALLSLPASGRQAYLERLVTSFDGNRHVKVTLLQGGHAEAVSQVAPYEDAPDWFVSLLNIPVQHRDDFWPGSGRDMLLVTSDPHNEISESWDQFRDGAAILGMFSLLVLGLLHLLMGRVAVSLRRLVAGFEAVGGGHYEARIAVKGAREVSLLAEAFNRMAERLQGLEAANRRMSGQMLAIQEEERADLARDLHDEMGPFLFAMRVDAETIARLAEPKSVIAARAGAIGSAVSHIQAHVRAILRQLRPGGLDEVGLAQAIANLVAFFQVRHDGIVIALALDENCDGLSSEMEAAIYRLVQEGLTNAARHSGAAHVWVTIKGVADTIQVMVEDDGRGFGASPGEGIGLPGMRERLQSLTGSLTIGPRPGGGARLTATLPRASVPARQEKMSA